MKNDYSSAEEALKAWHSEAWEWSREYFKPLKVAAGVCKDGDRFFIVTHPDCVAYRIKIGQLVFTL